MARIPSRHPGVTPVSAHADPRGERVTGLYARAVGCFQAGQWEDAERACAMVLTLDTRHHEALHLLGVIAHRQGQHVAAAELIAQAIAVFPSESSYHCNLAIVLQALGRVDAAVAHYERTLALKPDDAIAAMNLGNMLQARGQREAAVERYRQAIAARPDYAEAHMNLGNVLKDLGRLEEAMERYRRALELAPRLAEAHLNFGNLLQSEGRVEEALAAYERGLALRPDSAAALVNVGSALEAIGRHAEALRTYKEAVVLRPGDAQAQLNLALARLRRGDFSAGLPGYEWRWRTMPEGLAHPGFARPQWMGGPIRGKRILLHAEQGLGDCIQFLRYVPLVRAAVEAAVPDQGAPVTAAVIVEVPSALRRLAASVPGIAQLVTHGEPLPEFDLHCPLLSLPLAFGTRIDTIPARVPYVSVPEQARDEMEQRAAVHGWPLTPREGELRVGLVWAGNGQHANDRQRSIPLAELGPIFDITGVRYLSLQMGPPAAQLEGFRDRIIDLTPGIADLADTAARIERLDLVISVDTSVAHLAGALGKPVWVLLANNPDWRWFLEFPDSPWYPSARLFRQTRFRDWKGVVEQVGEALVSLAVASQPAVHSAY